jgi:hypothetical protein
MNYTDYTAALSQMTGLKDANGQVLLTALLPRIIEYAELRLFRDPELDFLAAYTTDTTQTTSPGVRNVSIPTQFIVIEEVRLILPANTRPDTDHSLRIPLLRVDRSFLDLTWPMSSATMTPSPWQTYYALWTEEAQQEDVQPPSSIIIAPTVDAAYVIEYIGTFRPPPLSANNQQTFLSMFLPDLMISASMIFACGGLLKAYGAMSDDPRAAVSWEAIYTEQKKGAAVEEARKRMESSGWSARAPAPLANISRTSLPTSPAAPGATAG